MLFQGFEYKPLERNADLNNMLIQYSAGSCLIQITGFRQQLKSTCYKTDNVDLCKSSYKLQRNHSSEFGLFPARIREISNPRLKA